MCVYMENTKRVLRVMRKVVTKKNEKKKKKNRIILLVAATTATDTMTRRAENIVELNTRVANDYILTASLNRDHCSG